MQTTRIAWVTLFTLCAIQPVASQASSDRVKRGAYLVTLGGCHDCHTPKTFTPQGPQLDSSRLLAGHPGGGKLPALPAGVLGPNAWGAVTTPDLTAWAGSWGVSFAANLTPRSYRTRGLDGGAVHQDDAYGKASWDGTRHPAPDALVQPRPDDG